MQALRLNTLSKLTFADSKRFDALIRDVFPGAEFKKVEQETLVEALRQATQEMNLEVVETQVRVTACSAGFICSTCSCKVNETLQVTGLLYGNWVCMYRNYVVMKHRLESQQVENTVVEPAFIVLNKMYTVNQEIFVIKDTIRALNVV